jgi:hypothetical protein
VGIVVAPRKTERRQPRRVARINHNYTLWDETTLTGVSRAHLYNGLTGNGTATGRYIDLQNQGTLPWGSSVGSTPLGVCGDAYGVDFTGDIANYLYQTGLGLGARNYALMCVFTPRVSSSDLVTRIPIAIGSDLAGSGALMAIRCADSILPDIGAGIRYGDNGAFQSIYTGITAEAGKTYAAAVYSKSPTEHYFFLDGGTYTASTDLGAVNTTTPNYTVGALRRGTASNPFNGVVQCSIRLQSTVAGGIPIDFLQKWTADPWAFFEPDRRKRVFSFPSGSFAAWRTRATATIQRGR